MESLGRAGSPAEADEFAVLTKRDAQVRMQNELRELMNTSSGEERLVINLMTKLMRVPSRHSLTKWD